MRPRRTLGVAARYGHRRLGWPFLTSCQVTLSSRTPRERAKKSADRARRRPRPRSLGADAALPDVLMAMASCERRADFSRPCGARLTDLAAARFAHFPGVPTGGPRQGRPRSFSGALFAFRGCSAQRRVEALLRRIALGRCRQHSAPQARIDRPVDKRRASHPLTLPRVLPKVRAGCALMTEPDHPNRSTITLSELSDIILAVRETNTLSQETPWWRGHAKAEWRLEAQAYRKNPEKPNRPSNIERALIGHFVSRAPSRSHRQCPDADSGGSRPPIPG
jgi:hypothetical protein